MFVAQGACELLHQWFCMRFDKSTLYVSEAETSDGLIPGYSSVGQHRKKLSDSAEKNFDTIKIVAEDSGQTKAVFTPAQTDTIIRDLRTFTKPDGLEITNYIFRRNTVEICYLCDETNYHNEDKLRQLLANHLKINSKMIKMTKLRANPIYTETSIRPGETATIQAKGDCKIGAFVHVEGQGNHALMSGHGKTPGDVLFHLDGRRLGVVNVALHPSLQHSAERHQDVALAKLDQQDDYIAHVSSTDNGQLRLAAKPVEAEEGKAVRCFVVNGNRGRVDSTTYIRCTNNVHDGEPEIEWRFISIKDDADKPVHGKGESGILVVDDEPEEGRVKAVGMLVGIDALPLRDKEETTIRTSIAVPLTTSFEDLERDLHCSGEDIKFLDN